MGLGSVVDTLIDVFLGGPSNWRDRLAGTIKFISPEGTEFEAKWRGSPRSQAKKLGILRHPKLVGDIVQDMDSASATYSITFFFDGENNDTEAAAFFQACRQNGTWEITHPVHGFLGLQLVSITEIDNPVDSGNITEFNSEWIEPIDPVTLKTAREAAGIVDAKIDDLNISAAQQFANNILQASETLKGAIETTTRGIANVTDYVLGPLFTTVDALDNAEKAIQQGITDTLQATVIQLEALAGQIQNLINVPLFANNKLEDRLEIYSTAVASFALQLPGETEDPLPPTSSKRVKMNSAATSELALTSSLAALCKIATTSAVSPRGLGPDDTGALATRAQAISASELLIAQFDFILSSLEATQEQYITEDIDNQFISQSAAYTDAAILVNAAIEYLLTVAFNLRVEKRFVLDKPRTPIEITITEYGDLGEDDSNLDLFIRSNELTGPDILLLPRGREVLVYV